MKSIARWVAAVGVVVSVFLTQGPRIDRDVAAQTRKPVMGTEDRVFIFLPLPD